MGGWEGGRKERGALCVVHLFAFAYLLCGNCLRYILDLNKEQEAGFVERVAAVAQKAEFKTWTEGKADGVHAVFVPQSE